MTTFSAIFETLEHSGNIVFFFFFGYENTTLKEGSTNVMIWFPKEITKRKPKPRIHNFDGIKTLGIK